MRTNYCRALIYKSMCTLLKIRAALPLSSRPETKREGPLRGGDTLILVLLPLQFLIQDCHLLYAFRTYLGTAAIDIENGTTLPA